MIVQQAKRRAKEITLMEIYVYKCLFIAYNTDFNINLEWEPLWHCAKTEGKVLNAVFLFKHDLSESSYIVPYSITDVSQIVLLIR